MNKDIRILKINSDRPEGGDFQRQFRGTSPALRPVAKRKKFPVTALNSPIPIDRTSAPTRGGPVDDFLDRLSHPAQVRSSNPVLAAFQCAFTLGLLPLVLWPMRWAEFLDSERRDLLELTAWWRRRVSSADAARLDIISSRLKSRSILMVISWLVVGFNGWLMGALLLQGESVHRLFDLTFQNSAMRHSPAFLDDRSYSFAWLPVERQLYGVWMVSLCLAYFLHLHAVRSHLAAVRSLVSWTNGIGRENRFERVNLNEKKSGLNPLGVLLAVVLCAHGAWWGIPMVLAEAKQRRYVVRTSPLVRSALASQARDAYAVVQGDSDRFCATGHCAARLPAVAKFCPRCGTAV